MSISRKLKTIYVAHIVSLVVQTRLNYLFILFNPSVYFSQQGQKKIIQVRNLFEAALSPHIQMIIDLGKLHCGGN